MDAYDSEKEMGHFGKTVVQCEMQLNKWIKSHLRAESSSSSPDSASTEEESESEETSESEEEFAVESGEFKMIQANFGRDILNSRKVSKNILIAAERPFTRSSGRVILVSSKP